ncbi:MAG: protein translocase subunit SecF [Candidatus Nealsonbacteria bacterium]|nr:protein translocase subunit SecF [Candidatus Nealsonbacteria bacterium]
MNIPFLKYRKIYFIFSGILILASLVCLVVFGLRPGIDFVGGSLLEVEFENRRPSSEEIRTELKNFNLGDIIIQPTGEKGLIIRMKETDTETRELIVRQLRTKAALTVMRNDLIGPVIGRELRERAKIIVALVVLAIAVYIALAFRRVSKPIASWQYSIVSLMALFHDVLIVLGVFSILGFFYYVEITIPIVTALLVVLGYSINNTVVVFDRIRENLVKRIGTTYQETVNKSLNQTFFRSINTSLTTLFVLIAIFFFGGVTLKYFALALIVGITAGTYSSFFLAGPILVSWLGLKTGREV